jgi:hypothetical protein
MEAHAQGVLLTAAKHHFKPTYMRAVSGSMNYKGPMLSLEDIDRKLANALANHPKG